MLDIKTICRTDDNCFVKITKGEGPGKQAVVTTFLTNRVGPDMRYFRAEADGSVDTGGLMYLERPVVLDQFGALSAPGPADPPDKVLTFTTNVSLDPRGRVTFFGGWVHRAGEGLVRRSYFWGWPPGMVKMIGSIGGPRSPVAPRDVEATHGSEGGVGASFLLSSDADDRLWVTAIITRGDKQGKARTFLRANRLGEDMRYYPAEKADGTDLAGGSLCLALDLGVVADAHGAMRRAEPRDAPASVDTLSAIVALDEHAHVTFFYGFTRRPGASYVKRFYLWGYSPETRCVEDPSGAPEGSQGRARKRDS
ncbi:MAG: hypothetical protein U0167_14080 [bacterium]